jgi:hypothetical protein
MMRVIGGFVIGRADHSCAIAMVADVIRIGCDPGQVRPGMLRVAPDRVNPIKRNTL